MDFFLNKEVLVTGGLGFLGSNLAIRLVQLGARVTVFDSMIEGLGGNLFNIEPIKDDIQIKIADIRDQDKVVEAVKGKDLIFHLAGQNDHILSLVNPFPDIDINVKGSAVLLEACKNNNPGARVIYTGTRGEYGLAAKLPVNEDSPVNPKGLYELTSMMAQKMFQIYHNNQKVRAVTLRLTNIYGERAQMKHNRFGVANWFVRLAIDNQTIKVFGSGSILRDFVYVQDAVDAIVMCAATDQAYGQVFNVGSDTPSNFLELAKTVIEVAGTGTWEFAPFTPERAAQEPGDYYSDITRIRKTVCWEPQTPLEQGLGQTIDFYRENKKHYW